MCRLRFFLNVRSPQKPNYPHRVANLAARGFAYLVSKPAWFIRFRGKENIPDPESGGLLIAANHQTYFDPAWVCIPVPHKLQFMAWDEAFGWKFIGPMIAYLGAFPVSLDAGGTLKAMKQALRALRDGAALTVFPEGARQTGDGDLMEFKNGVVRMAMQARVPILPVTIVGGNRVWPRGQKFPSFFTQVEIVYHPTIDFTDTDDSDEALNAATARLKEIIASGKK